MHIPGVPQCMFMFGMLWSVLGVELNQQPIGMEHYDTALAYPVQSPGVVGNQPDVVMDSLSVHGLGMKVYVIDEKEAIMEPILKWVGNPDITIAVKAFGPKATIRVFDL
ncbi:hypothetical protein OIU76_019189 [Salix suchowensis]|nr:hypothetical protein OIU76_019189 [Salix suchowensis]